MKSSKSGFTLVFILPIIAMVAVTLTVGNYYLKARSQKVPAKPMINSETQTATATPTAQIITPDPVKKPPSSSPPAPTTGTIKIHVGETTMCASEPINCYVPGSDNPITLPDRLTLRIINTDTNTRYEKSGATDWSVYNLSPGHYKVMNYYRDPYIAKGESSCQNCPDFSSAEVWESYMRGYEFNLKAGLVSVIRFSLKNEAKPILGNK